MVVAGIMRAAPSQPGLRRKRRRQDRDLQRPRDFELGFELRLCLLERRRSCSASSRVRSATVFSRMCVCSFRTRSSRSSRKRPHGARVDAREVERRDRDQVHQPLEAEDEGPDFLGRREAQQVLEREDGDDDDLFDAKHRLAQAGRPGVASKMTDATLSTISARMRFSNQLPKSPCGASQRAARARTASRAECTAAGGEALLIFGAASVLPAGGCRDGCYAKLPVLSACGNSIRSPGLVSSPQAHLQGE